MLINEYQIFFGKLGNCEMDFIGRQGEATFYIQVAVNVAEPATLERGFGNLLMIQYNHPKYVVTLDEYARATTSELFI